jgi:hypothetical protein
MRCTIVSGILMFEFFAGFAAFAPRTYAVEMMAAELDENCRCTHNRDGGKFTYEDLAALSGTVDQMPAN